MTAVTLHDADGNPVIRFAPAKNITAYELALITNLFVKKVIGREDVADWRSYLEEHKLGRHFEVV